MATHATQIVPRFGELDPYNHVNHAVYVSYFAAARCLALESADLALPDRSGTARSADSNARQRAASKYDT